ncbi:DUF1269 domain-containing protein [Pseudothioclava nitratireducens]|uniref:DUF1269 domain-containing protein n=1 Tax=Pseudothioclava nitratireducens TaxID=1928646 RepID=UPI0023DBC5FB|nr:DUF1269 domain-containing protein [Defluviimonas nitratireducens]MDF1620474.1 DUF1269 domain-containing protein [Defluviimonas nitratireducens]
MSELLVMAFDTKEAGFEMRDALIGLRKDGLVEAGDIVVVTRADDGAPQLHQTVNLTAAGALGGGFWGALIGLLFLSPVAGAAVGAGVGAVAGAHTDIGVNDEFLRAAGRLMPNEGSAVFVLMNKTKADDMLARLNNLGLEVSPLRTDLPEDFETRLTGVLNLGGAARFDGREITQGSIGRLARVVGTSAM